MDKMMGEEDFKGLEEEMDEAVDRLFVEKKRGGVESFLMESPTIEPPLEARVSEPSIKPPTFEPSTKSPVFEPAMESLILEPATEPSLLEPSYEIEKYFDRESSLPSPSAPVPFLKSIEKMEAQLLSLEWEITEEKLKTTKEEILEFGDLMKQ